MPEEVFQAEYEAQKKALAQARQANAEGQQLRAQMARLKQQTEEWQAQSQVLRPQLDAEKEAFMQAQANWKALNDHLPKEYAQERALEKALARLLKELEIYQKAMEQLQAAQKEGEDGIKTQEAVKKENEKILAQLKSKQEDIEKKILRELKKRGFKDQKALQAALREKQAREALQAHIDRWNDEHRRWQDRLDQIIKKIGTQMPPQLQALEQDKNLKTEALEQHKALITTLSTQIQDFENRLDRLLSTQVALEQLQAEASHTLSLFALANGDNALKQKFQTYVISVFLDEVIEYANRRLARLSQDRYQLFRSEEVKGGGKKGLELAVFDNHSGKERPVNSLSGGETFFTSLALALGLADVATANAGGLRLDAMFIDEGFGTLDSETLDLAIATLMNLDGEHRLVGIISHVAELKERIAASRLEVIKGKNGSQIKIHRG
ncbi:MAG: hypothetical protein HC913_02365 [Microscillaceae bacterium]|nr:hypothetical protein [Microscillaceae bacterium]